MAGLYLVGCGSSSNLALPETTPNGFLFKNVLGPGSPLDAGRTLHSSAKALTGAVQICDSGELVFQGKNETGQVGAYRARLDKAHNLGPVEKIVAVGDLLPDGSRVRVFSTGDTGPQGQWATVIADDRGGESVYLQSAAGAPLRQVARINDSIDGGTLGAGFSNLSLHSDDDMLLVAYYAPEGQVIPRQGLFLLPGSDRAASRRLLATGNLMPESSDTIGMIGMPHLDDDGNYAVQLTSARSNRPRETNARPLPAMSLAVGNVADVAPQLLAASPDVTLTPAGPSSARFVGSTPLNGPRLKGSRLGLVLHDSPTNHRLVLEGTTLLSTGDLSPSGQPVATMYPPVFGASQAVFGVLFSQDGERRRPELAMLSAAGAQTILQAGDVIGDKAIQTFELGVMTSQVDSTGRMVMVSSYSDKSRGLLVAVPV
jgi:hypothetical protein